MNNTSSFKTAKKGLITLMCIFPFFITNVYANITISKCCFFIIVSTISFIICFSKELFRLRKEPGSWVLKKVNPEDMCMYLLGFVVIFSTISSDYVEAAITGKAGRYMGLIIWLAFIMAYVFISKFYYLRERELRMFAISFMVMCIFGAIQFVGYDPFYMFAGTGEGAKKTFIGFIGNINVYGGYLCFGVPLAAYLFCFEKSKTRMILWCATCCAGIVGLITSSSDCAYLGIGITLLILFYIVLKEQAALIRYIHLLLILLLTCAVFKVICLFYYDTVRTFSFLGRFITNFKILAAIGIPLLLMVNFFETKKLSQKSLKILRKLYCAAIIIGFAGIIFLIIWFTFIDKDTDIGILKNYFRVDKHWGSDRGYIWKLSMRAFNDLPLYKKIIGCGPDTLVIDLQKSYRKEMYDSIGFYFDNAHNEVLQYLATIGIWGVLLYLAVIVLSLKKCLRSDNLYHRALAMPVIAYFVQSLVNIHQPITTPLFFVFLALTQCELYKDKCIIHNPTKEIQQEEDKAYENK